MPALHVLTPFQQSLVNMYARRYQDLPHASMRYRDGCIENILSLLEGVIEYISKLVMKNHPLIYEFNHPLIYEFEAYDESRECLEKCLSKWDRNYKTGMFTNYFAVSFKWWLINCAKRELRNLYISPQDAMSIPKSEMFYIDDIPDRGYAYDDDYYDSNQEIDYSGPDILERLHRAVDKLSERNRNLFDLRVTEGRSFKEIGDRLGVSPEAARQRFHRLLPKLRRHLTHPANDVEEPSDRDRLLTVLRRESRTRDGRIPGRRRVCELAGLSQYAYQRLMDNLRTEGLVIGRSGRYAGRLADHT